jgi:diadenosine tetraphosphate (Ap4A) HIT family hydrolase
MVRCIFCDIDFADIISSYPNFYVKVGKAISTAGHVLIIPKKHFSCLAELPDELLLELDNIKHKVTRVVTEHFSRPFFIEYGIWGQTVKHAHMHCIPIGNFDVLDENLKNGTTLGDNIKSVFNQDGQYVYIEQNGKYQVFRPTGNRRTNLLDYRRLFLKLGNQVPLSWMNMTSAELEEDERRITETKEKIIL